jgi:predicted RNase H-like HicB family nuclease
MSMKAFNIQVELSKQEDGLWRATVPGVQGCWVDAETVKQALEDIQDVAVMVFDLMEENHQALPPAVSPTGDTAFSARIPVVIQEHPFVRRAPRRAKAALR